MYSGKDGFGDQVRGNWPGQQGMGCGIYRVSVGIKRTYSYFLVERGKFTSVIVNILLFFFLELD